MDRASRGDGVKRDTTTLLVLLFVLTRCGKPAAQKWGRYFPPPPSTWPPDPDGYNVPVIPLPPNPLEQEK